MRSSFEFPAKRAIWRGYDELAALDGSDMMIGVMILSTVNISQRSSISQDMVHTRTIIQVADIEQMHR
jgi:hypothetical protein